ncbi:13895_t:CDS:2 [Acaulospora colombiana]|uniref:13895_t:CDS:1 n=1 Tax=Acaulospora colombiana TaxID=27376 RepID=A0ACA9NSV0_9GLOM|nr:13895_t:CDS:2 [Acaulospora colombiana]
MSILMAIDTDQVVGQGSGIKEEGLWAGQGPAENVSEEEFRRSWEKEQAPRLVPLMKKHGALFYSQVRTHPTPHLAHPAPLVSPPLLLIRNMVQYPFSTDAAWVPRKGDCYRIAFEHNNVVSQAMYKDDAHTLDYDGIATTVFPSVEAAEAYIKDPEQFKILGDGSRDFMEHPKFRVAGGEEVIFLNALSNK